MPQINADFIGGNLRESAADMKQTKLAARNTPVL